MRKTYIALVLVIAAAALVIIAANQQQGSGSAGAGGTESGEEYITLPSGDEIGTKEYETAGESGTGAPAGQYVPANADYCTGMEGFEKDSCLTTTASALGDAAPCASVGAYEERGLCYMEAALKSGNAGLCGQAESSKDACYAEAAVSSNDYSLCMKAGVEQDYCLYTVGTSSLNAAACANISLAVPKDNCYFMVASGKNDVSLCGKMSQSGDVCIAEIAYNTGNSALCEQAKDKAECYAQLEG
ncbi:MAG: hypothetical protein V1676_03440 [Candidatus Diapherotrites archaeon]